MRQRDHGGGSKKAAERDVPDRTSTRARTSIEAVLRLQSTAGNRAVARALTADGSRAPLQRKLDPKPEKDVATPAGVISDVLKIAGKAQNLPGTNPVNPVDRATVVEATVNAKSLRQKPREKDPILAKVTSMARAEQFLLQGVDLKGFYQAGHLIGDQLVAESDNSFVFGNLAPQVAAFNAPDYSATEAKIRAMAETRGLEVKMKVVLKYGAPYDLTVAHVQKRLGVAPPPTVDPNKKLTIPRRIPISWSLEATYTKPADLKVSNKPPKTKPGLGATTMATPYSLSLYVQKFDVAPPTGGGDSPAKKLKLAPLRGRRRELEAVQWVPSDTVRDADVLAWLEKSFPDLGSKIVDVVTPQGSVVVEKAHLALIKDAAGSVAMALVETTSLTATAVDPSELGSLIAAFAPRVKELLDKARSPATTLAEAAGHLVSARSMVDDLKEEIEAVVAAQRLKYPFALATVAARAQQVSDWEKDFHFSQQQPQPAFAPATEKGAQAEQAIGPSTVVDLSKTNVRVARFDGGPGGVVFWPFLGPCPVKARQWMELPGGEIVIATNAVVAGGEWAISWVPR